ncbi:hypothetical protein BRC81_03685 [Halobacteriales archaeon QS_1_68_20]|nr:MAG: hypothetical protein BRC81_03685 [Halobacteriales archaeon QS_1_68_20]
MTGEVRDTYHAALQHDLVELPEDAHLVGVVRKPTPWFTQIDENRPELGPPGGLLDEAKAKTDDLKMRGTCDEGAHNAAWEETEFEARYRKHIESSSEAQAALDDLAERVESGETVVLVCYEGDDKRCHRRILRDVLADRTSP